MLDVVVPILIIIFIVAVVIIPSLIDDIYGDKDEEDKK